MSKVKGVTIAAVEHAIAILHCLSGAGEPLGTNEIARRVGLHKSSISRLLATLAATRLIEKEPGSGRVKLGAGLLILAAPVLADLRINDLVRPVLEDLAKRSGETASYNIWDGNEAVTIEQVAGPAAVKIFSPPGRRDPPHCSASGKILLAHQTTASIDAVCERPLQRFTEYTIVDPAKLRADIEESRRRGYATNLGEIELDVSAISAAAHDARGKLAGSITLVVPSYRFSLDRRESLAGMVVEGAKMLSQRL